MPIKKIALAAVIATIIILYFVGGGEKYLSIRLYQDLFASSPVATAVIFFAVFFIGTGCSLPVTGVLALASGIVFGTVTGFLLSLAATTLGGTVALYSTRLLFYDLVSRKFAGQVEMVNQGIEKEGAFYLFGLRMIPVIPFRRIEPADGVNLHAGTSIYARNTIRYGASHADFYLCWQPVGQHESHSGIRRFSRPG